MPDGHSRPCHSRGSERLHAFELKANNKIESISQAIGQAINYKPFANYSYIIIPLFDYSSFYDTDRLQQFLSMCKSNGVGVVSIDINTETHEINDLIEVLSANYVEISDSTRLEKILEKSPYMRCPLCRNVVLEDPDKRQRCGWKIKANNSVEFNENCMKDIIEKIILSQYFSLGKAGEGN